MKHQKIEINNKVYQVKVAESEEEYDDGLMNIKELPEDEGMLFPFDTEDVYDFWMKDTFIPLDIIYLNSDLEVTKIIQGEPESEEIISGQGKYVLELNVNSGVKLDDEVEFIDNDDDTDSDDEMHVIGLDGNSLMTLKGGERIFSRKDTTKLVKFAKKAYESELDSDYRALGKRVFKFLEIQDNNTPEFVEKS